MAENKKLHLCKIISVCNQKSGVAKTTTSTNLAKGLANNGKKVLLIDFDPQANATQAFGIPNTDVIDATITELCEELIKHNFRPEIDDKDFAKIQIDENLDIIPANIGLSELEPMLYTATGGDRLLKYYVGQQRRIYDYIIIDCSPSLQMSINPLTCSDSVIIPIEASNAFSFKGLQQLMRKIEYVSNLNNNALKIEGILFTKYSPKDDEKIKVIKDRHPELPYFNKPIARSTVLKQLQTEGKLIVDVQRIEAGIGYRVLVKEVIRNAKN